MRSLYCDEDAIKVPAPEDVKSDQPYLLGSLFGVFVSDAKQGEDVAFKTVGCVRLPTDGTIDAFDRVFWDSTEEKVAASGDVEVGVAIRDTENGITITRLGVNTALPAPAGGP